MKTGNVIMIIAVWAFIVFVVARLVAVEIIGEDEKEEVGDDTK